MRASVDKSTWTSTERAEQRSSARAARTHHRASGIPSACVPGATPRVYHRAAGERGQAARGPMASKGVDTDAHRSPIGAADAEAVRAQRLGRHGTEARDVPAVRSLGAQVGWQASVPRLECACGGGCCGGSREICIVNIALFLSLAVRTW